MIDLFLNKWFSGGNHRHIIVMKLLTIICIIKLSTDILFDNYNNDTLIKKIQ
jgi:hypothetical protein